MGLFQRLIGRNQAYLRGTRVEEDLPKLLKESPKLAEQAMGFVYRIQDTEERQRMRAKLIYVLAELTKADNAMRDYKPGQFDGAAKIRNQHIERQVNQAVREAENLAGKILQMPAKVRSRHENATRETVDKTSAGQFLRGELALGVSSSWVHVAKYFPDKNQLQLTFRNGHTETYGEFSEKEAKDFLRAPSKGNWVWQTILGNRNPDGTWQHKKPRV